MTISMKIDVNTKVLTIELVTIVQEYIIGCHNMYIVVLQRYVYENYEYT